MKLIRLALKNAKGKWLQGAAILLAVGVAVFVTTILIV